MCEDVFYLRKIVVKLWVFCVGDGFVFSVVYILVFFLVN